MDYNSFKFELAYNHRLPHTIRANYHWAHRINIATPPAKAPIFTASTPNPDAAFPEADGLAVLPELVVEPIPAEVAEGLELLVLAALEADELDFVVVAALPEEVVIASTPGMRVDRHNVGR